MRPPASSSFARLAPSASRRAFLATSAIALAAIAGCARDAARAIAPATPGDPVWDPSRTYAFFVGLVDFADPVAYPSFDVDDRRDRELFERLVARGVPPAQALFLDGRDASLSSIRARLDAMLARTRPGDLLWLHYSGHGSRQDDGEVHFAAYDSSDDDATGWSLRSIFDAVERGHRGELALLTADCCAAGALAQQAAARRGRVGYGCITSSRARESSTGAWTFTDCLLDAVSGSAELDLDRDGRVRFEEVGRYCEVELAFVDGQLADHAATGRFPARMILADARPASLRRERVEVRRDDDDGERWSRAHLLRRAEGRARVRLLDDGDDDPHAAAIWVDEKDVRPWAPTNLARGAAVVVVGDDDADEGHEDGSAEASDDAPGAGSGEGGETTRAAHVLEARLGVHLVRYDDDPRGVEDEWLASWDLRSPGAARGAPKHDDRADDDDGDDADDNADEPSSG